MKTEIYKRTPEEISEAVKLLKQNIIDAPVYNMFGQDNHARTRVRIDTIENKRSEDYVYTHYPSSNEEDEEDMELHDLFLAAISALEYLRGGCPIDHLLVPSKTNPKF